MSLGKMNVSIDILTVGTTKDSDGFGTTEETVVASVRAYKEERYATERWANRAAFSEATALFRFRTIPGVEISTKTVIVCKGKRYDVTGVRDVRGRGMYVEVLVKEVAGSSG